MYSILLSQILRESWFLRPEDVIAGQSIVHQLLSGEFSGKPFEILSSKTPIPQSLADGESSSYDTAQKGSVAIFSIKGTLLKNGTLCSYGTEEIAAEINRATQHPNIAAIVLDIDSGGGAVNAVAPLAQAIARAKAAGKPVVASCDIAASAAYWLASCCNKIVANNDISSAFGSIGVMCSFVDVKGSYEAKGYKFHEIYADQSANKNEAFTLALQGNYDKIKAESLNPLAISFQDTVKANRPALQADAPGVLSGKMFYAREALEIGLIDEIGSLSTAVELAKATANEILINQYIK